MKRRQFIKALAIVSGATVTLTGGAYLLIENVDKAELTIASAINKLDQLATLKLNHSGDWHPSKIFMHCAQSIEMSMTGYPEHKSALFKDTLGRLAFNAFASKGKMTHNLNEPIPGAPPLIESLDASAAIEYLKQRLIDFAQYQGELKPHFAYGTLSKEQYALAHVIHLYNHLQEIQTHKLT